MALSATNGSYCKGIQRVAQLMCMRKFHLPKRISKKCGVFPGRKGQGKLPLRITHNDTKLNNILFDEQDQAVCVIDLDTVMPGLSLYDFGDLVRTATNTAKEDEQDLERIQFSVPVFREIARGFLESTVAFSHRG
jgi:serine/threonine protein kinase